MKWIKNRKSFLNEAKIKDVVFPKQKQEISNTFGEKYLEYEEVDPTDKIKQGKWKLSGEDKMEVLGKFFDVNMNNVFKIFESLDDHFCDIINNSIDLEKLDEKFSIIMENFDIRKPTIDQITCLNESVFQKLSINDTKGSSIIKKDDNGRPIRDEDNNMIRIEKEPGEPIYDKNLCGINTFVDSYNKSYKDKPNIQTDKFHTRDISNLVSLSKENHNRQFKFDFKIFDRDLYLSINHNAKDILNMSISKFFGSCQHLYDGDYRSQLLSNVFDPNSIPAFLIFDTPIFWDDDKISDFLPLSRMFVRSIENFDDEEENDIFFDKAYPDRIKSVFDKIVEKYSDNIQTGFYGDYIYSPDIDLEDNLDSPYMDRLGMNKVKMIGKNAKKVYLNRNYDWSKVKISPQAKIEELVIESEKLPSNFSKIKLKPDWVKFRFLTIKNLEDFANFKMKSVAFDKCKFDLNQLNSLNGIDKLRIVSCDLDGVLDLSNFNNLKELHLLFTLDDLNQLKSNIENLNSIDKLVLSSDLFLSKEDKNYLKELKNKFNVEIKGPMI